MKTFPRFAAGLLGLAVILTMAGCDNAKDMQIQALQERLDELEKERDELRNRLNQAMQGGDSRLQAALAEADDARKRALQLQQMLDQARAQLADAQNRPMPASNLPAGWTGNDNIAWTDIADDILFDAGDAKLKSSGMAKLREVYAVVQSNFPDKEVWVVGHTDSDPIRRTAKMWQDNLDLSVNRAGAVVRELWRMGLDRARVVAAGQGEYNPKAPNTSRGNKALNRRVQIIVVTRPPMNQVNTPTQGDTGIQPSQPPAGGSMSGGEQG